MKIKLIDGTIEDTDNKNDIDAFISESSHNLIQEYIKYDIPMMGVIINSKNRPRFITHIHSFEQNKECPKGQFVKEVKLEDINRQDWVLYTQRMEQLISGIQIWLENVSKGTLTIARKINTKDS